MSTIEKNNKEAFACHPKTGHVILSRENAGEAYLRWKEGLMNHLNAEQLPSDYEEAEEYSDHLTKVVAKPVISMLNVGTENERIKAWKAQIWTWKCVESSVKEKVGKHLQGHLRNTFERSATCHEGWEELNKVISYDRESQVDLLEQELHGFAQRANESYVNYAERFATLIFKLKSVDRPDPEQHELVEEFNWVTAKRFCHGMNPDG